MLADTTGSLKDNVDLILEACSKDFGKPMQEAYTSEAGWLMNDCIFMDSNVKRWANDEKAADVPLTTKLMSPTIRKEPMGVVLIIGAFNFPFQLSIAPLIGAIAAGCTAVLKPSEGSPASAAVMEMIVTKYLDNSAFKVVNGAVPETTALLERKWDLIFYTGSANVGTIVAKKAAETLTPVVLELGGKNPAIITKHADMRLAARRTLWTKIMNAGQICVSQNHILIDEEVVNLYVAELKAAYAEFFPNGARGSPDFSRIINNRHFKRIKKMIDDSKGKIVMGGAIDEETNYIEPTAILLKDSDDSLLSDESFGPLIPILPVKDLDEAIKLTNEISVTPLAIYAFGSKAETNKGRPHHPAIFTDAR
jgi:beta-apo-4'-carotenal oxygenase